MASNHDFECTKTLLKCTWGAHFSDEFNLNIVEENGFSPNSDSSSPLEKSSREQLFQLSPYLDECILARCKLKMCRKLVKAQNLTSHITDFHRLSIKDYIRITNLDGQRKTINNSDDDVLTKMINNFECDQIEVETDQFKTKNYNQDINIFQNYEKNCSNSNGIVPFSPLFVDNRKRPLVYSTQSTAKKKVKLNPHQEHKQERITPPRTMAGIVQAQRLQELTYSISRKFHKSPVASAHGRLKLERHNRIVYPSYKIQRMQIEDVIKHKDTYFQNADEARRSSVSSLKDKTPPVHPVRSFTSEAESSDNHHLKSNNSPLTYSKMVYYRRENCRRNSSSDEWNTSPPSSLSNKIEDATVTENSECPVLRIKSLDLHRPETAEPDVDACSSSTSSNNVITDEERSSPLEEKRRETEADVTSDSDVKCSSDDETDGTSSSPSEQPSEDEQDDEEKSVSFLDEKEEHPEKFSQKKCFSMPNSDSPSPKECQIENETFLGVKKGSSSSDSCSSAESSVEDSENEDLSDEEEELSEEDDEEEERSDEENDEVKKEEIFNKEDEVENKQVLSKDVEVSGKKADEEEEVFKDDDDDDWWDRRSSLTCAGSDMNTNWWKNSKFNLVSFKAPPSKFVSIVKPVNNKKSVITHKSNMSNKSVGTRLSEGDESNFDFGGKVLVACTPGVGTDNPKDDLEPDEHKNISPTSKKSSRNSVENSAVSISPNKATSPDLAKNSNSISHSSTSTTSVESQPKKQSITDKSDSTSVINREFSLKNNHLKFHMPHTLFSSLGQQDKARDEMLRKVKLPDPNKEPFKQPILSPISFSNQSAIQQTSVPKPNNIQAVKAQLDELVCATNSNINKCDKVANLHPPVNGIKWKNHHYYNEPITKMQGDKEVMKMQLGALVNSCLDGRKLKGDSSRSEAKREIILGIKKGPFTDPSISSSELPLEKSYSNMRKDSSNVMEDNEDKQYLKSGPWIQNGY